jgi:hypothetical protein
MSLYDGSAHLSAVMINGKHPRNVHWSQPNWVVMQYASFCRVSSLVRVE